MPLLSAAQTRAIAWSTPVVKGSLLRLRRLKDLHCFSLREASALCYRIAGAGAVLLSFQPYKTVASLAENAAHQVSAFAHVSGERDTAQLGEVHAQGLLNFIVFAKDKLAVPVHPRLLEFIAEVIKRHAAAYYAAEPDIHPEIAIGLLYDLVWATAYSGGRKPYEIVISILEEFNSIPLPPTGDRIQLGPDQLRQVRAQAAATKVGSVASTPDITAVIDHAPRLERLLERRAKLLKTGARSLSLERIESEIVRVRNWVIQANAENDEAPF